MSTFYGGGCVLVNNRFHGVLGDMSLVDITRELMDTALEYGEMRGVHYSYFCLLSGQDYPIVPYERIIDELRCSYPKPFLDCTPWSPDNWVGAGSSNCPWFCSSMNAINAHMRRTPMRKLVKLPLMALNAVGKHLSTPKSQLVKNGVDLFGGSAWWLLPDDMVKYLHDVMGDPERRRKYLPVEYVACPEESYFQTLMMDSVFYDRIDLNPTNAVLQNCKTYANFNPIGKQFTGHPYIFTMDDKVELTMLSHHHYFARKFDMTVDSEVLDWIDEKLLNIESGY